MHHDPTTIAIIIGLTFVGLVAAAFLYMALSDLIEARRLKRKRMGCMDKACPLIDVTVPEPLDRVPPA